MSGVVVNPFRTAGAAQRYAAGRPDVHALFVHGIRRALGDIPLRRVLDVACGTCLSTRSVARAAGFVVGLDVARTMLVAAGGCSGAALVQGCAEALPFPPAAFDLLTMGCAFHWCDPTRVLGELYRVLAPHGHLAVYKHWFAGRMEGEPRFAAWHDRYRRQFAPPRRHASFDPARATGFLPVGTDRFQHSIPLTRDELVRYLTSQSNVLSAVEGGRTTFERAESELHASLAPIFGPRESARFAYAGELAVLRKS